MLCPRQTLVPVPSNYGSKVSPFGRMASFYPPRPHFPLSCYLPTLSPYGWTTKSMCKAVLTFTTLRSQAGFVPLRLWRIAEPAFVAKTSPLQCRLYSFVQPGCHITEAHITALVHQAVMDTNLVAQGYELKRVSTHSLHDG
jgi:hypothetical protein